jgi:hypothetical protein
MAMISLNQGERHRGRITAQAMQDGFVLLACSRDKDKARRVLGLDFEMEPRKKNYPVLAQLSPTEALELIEAICKALRTGR